MFCVDIDNNDIIYTLDQFCFFFIIYLFILFTQVLVTWSLPFMCVVKVKVDLRSCEDKVRVNYFQLS